MLTTPKWLEDIIEIRYKLRCSFRQELRQHFTEKELIIIQVASINLEYDFLCIRSFIDDKGVPSSYCFVVIMDGFPEEAKLSAAESIESCIDVLWLGKNTVETLVDNFISFIKTNDINEPWTTSLK